MFDSLDDKVSRILSPVQVGDRRRGGALVARSGGDPSKMGEPRERL